MVLSYNHSRKPIQVRMTGIMNKQDLSIESLLSYEPPLAAMAASQYKLNFRSHFLTHFKNQAMSQQIPWKIL